MLIVHFLQIMLLQKIS